MIEPVRQALRGLEVTLSKVDRFDPANAVMRFTVGMRNVVESVVVPGLMRIIARTAPRIDISIVRAERRELERELSADNLDAAIDVLLPLPEEIRRQRIDVEGLTVVVRRRHPHVRSMARSRHLPGAGTHSGLIAPPGLECGGLRARPA